MEEGVTIKDGMITCNKCEWSWSIDEAGDDPYNCHKCDGSIEEDGSTALGSVPGMGAPEYASREGSGSGDVPTPGTGKKTKGKNKRIKNFWDFNKR